MKQVKRHTYNDLGNGLLFCRECHVSIVEGTQREHERQNHGECQVASCSAA